MDASVSVGVLIFFSFIVVLSSWRTEDELMSMYDSWLQKHGRSYNALGEKERRFQIFKDNLRFIDDHNSVQNRTYRLGLNRFADLTNEEYRSMYLGGGFQRKLSSTAGKRSDRYLPKLGESLPDSVDWRKEGAVAGVKDQGRCGSSWAFSAITSVEGINKIVTGQMITLSEQELVDCDTDFNRGCNGGHVDYAFQFIISNGGIDTDVDYPYYGRHQYCDPERKNPRVVKIDAYENVPIFDERALTKALASQPVSAAIESGGRDFQFYDSGIFTGNCGIDLDHSVAAVGYGSENGLDYWIVRNSWGAAWGEDGYIRLERNILGSNAGKCGIAIAPSYPVKESQDPGPSPPSPVTPPTVCDDYYICPQSTTCCCDYEYFGFCIQWGCCPREGAICCDDFESCCPYDFPVCNTETQTCLVRKGYPWGVKAMKRIEAKPRWASA